MRESRAIFRMGFGPLLAVGIALVFWVGPLGARQTVFPTSVGFVLLSLCLIFAAFWLSGTASASLTAALLAAFAFTAYFQTFPARAPLPFLPVIVGLALAFLAAGLAYAYRRVRRVRHERQGDEVLKSYEEQVRTLFLQIPAIMTLTHGPEHRYVMMNRAAEKLFGGFDIIGKTVREVFPEQADTQFLRDFDSAFSGEEVVRSEFPLTHDWSEKGKMETRWFNSLRQPLRSPSGGVVGVLTFSTDVTELVQDRKKLEESERTLRALSAEAEKSRDHLNVILQNLADGITVQDAAGNLIYANAPAARLTGYDSADEMLRADPKTVLEKFVLHDEHGEPLSFSDLPGRLALQGKATPEMVVGFSRRDGAGETKWSLVKARPVLGPDRDVKMAVNIFRDISSERRAWGELSRNHQRLEFLAKAGELLFSSLDYESVLARVARLAVPEIADWAAVDILDPGGQVRRLAVAHQDPEKTAFAYEIQRRFPPDMARAGGVVGVLKSGQPAFYPNITPDMLTKYFENPEHRLLIERIGFRSVIIVPLKTTERTVGAISFVTAESGHRYTEEDLQFAEELAARASLAIENARLYSELEAIAQREHEEAMLLEMITAHAPIGWAFFSSDLRLLRLNTVLAELSDMPVERQVGRRLGELLPDYAEEIEALLQEVLKTGQPILNHEVEGVTRTRPLVKRQWLQSFYPVRSRTDTLLGVGVIVHEITDRKAAEKEIYLRAYTDPLTKLPNRKAFEENLQTLLERSRAAGTEFAVGFMDIDRLKVINDSLGHSAGDAVLSEVADRIRGALHPGESAYRWAGDEFVLLFPRVGTSHEAAKAAGRILHELNRAVRVGEHSLHATASLGLSLFPHDGTDARSLQKNADAALYRAKEAGKNRHALYTQSMNVDASQEMLLENELRQAVQNGDFELYYQPVVDLKTQVVTSVEALLRWQHPRLGRVGPSKFIPIAEELGLIGDIGNWVLRTACTDVEYLRAKGIPPLKIALNLSPRQFGNEVLVENFSDILREKECPSDIFEVEITESVAMENINRTRRQLEDLRAMGISVTIDDFGTGYSSLNYLKRFPIEKLKIDKSFVRHCLTDEQDTSIIKAIISMAGSLHLKVVAEGVDTEQQLNLLASLGCDAAQGYVISRPLIRSELAEFIKNRLSEQAVVPVETVAAGS